MLEPDEKRFFIELAAMAAKLSGCSDKQGAVLTRERRILSYGFNRKIVRNKEWEVSAIYDVLFGARVEDLTGTAVFCTYFPQVDDLKLIAATGVASIYFNGKISDPEAVKLINALTESDVPLEIIELNLKKS